MNTGITPLTPSEEASAKQQTAREGYLKRDLVAVDIAINVISGGQEDVTISSRAAMWATGKTGVKGFIGRLVSKGLNLIQPNHGAQAQAGDLERAEATESKMEGTGTLPTK